MNKSTRLAIFYERLRDASPASSHDEAYELLSRILNAVEDEYSGVPNDPANWQTDGRLYPPQKDRVYAVSGFPRVLRYNSFKHDTFIAAHGAIEVKLIATGVVHFEKPGANGKGVWG